MPGTGGYQPRLTFLFSGGVGFGRRWPWQDGTWREEAAMTSPVPDIDPTGTALGATIVTVLVTPALSLLVLWRFRRAVERSMRSVGGAP